MAASLRTSPPQPGRTGTELKADLWPVREGGMLDETAGGSGRSGEAIDPSGPGAMGLDTRGAQGPQGYAFDAQQRLNNRLYTHAMRGRNAEVLAVLLEGADLHDKDDNALRSAAGAGRMDTVALLLDQGADVQAREHHALRLAARGGHREVVVLLLQRGADLSAAGFDALVQAVAHGRATTVTALLNHAQAQGLVVPLDALERADATAPEGSSVKHAAAREALAPALRLARTEQERSVLHAETNAVLRTVAGTTDLTGRRALRL